MSLIPHCRSVSVLLRNRLYVVPFSRKSGQYYLSIKFNVSIFGWLTHKDYFAQTVDPKELLLNKIYTSDTEAQFSDLDLCGTPWTFLLPFVLSVSISNIIFTKIYDKRNDFDFYIVIFRFWMVMSPVLHPIMYLISQSVRFASCQWL